MLVSSYGSRGPRGFTVMSWSVEPIRASDNVRASPRQKVGSAVKIHSCDGNMPGFGVPIAYV